MDLDKLTIDRGPGPRRAYRRRSPVVLLSCVAASLAALWFFRAPLAELVRSEGDNDRTRTASGGSATGTTAGAGAGATNAAGDATRPQIKAPAISGTAANGYLVARRRAALSADTPGRIVELHVEEGTVLKKGDVVARLFSSELEAALRGAEAELVVGEVRVRSAEAAITAARRRLEEAEALVGNVTSQRDEVAAAVKLAQSEFERFRGLFDRGAVPREQLDRAESALAQGRARLAGAESGLVRTRATVASAESDIAVAILAKEQAQASIATLAANRDLAQATLDKTYVRAPFDGVVVLKDAEVGEVVSPNALGGQSRGSVATMVDFSTLEVQVELPETSLGSVQVGLTAEVYLDAFSKERFEGTVERIWPTANRQKATVEVRVGLTTIDPRMRPEMGVRVVFPPKQ